MRDKSVHARLNVLHEARLDAFVDAQERTFF
jgi:hypothetical protein